MSSGHRGTEAASPSAVINLFSKPGYTGLLNFVGTYGAGEPSNWRTSRKYLVPFGAGRSMDGEMTYLDEGIPLRFKCGIEPDKYTAGHEGFEWWMMTRKDKWYWHGGGACCAHWWATGYEHLLLKLDGYSDDEIAAYEKEWLEYISQDEAERISPDTVPPDLFTGPYEEGEDNDPGEAEMSAKILPILRQARARIIPVQEMRV